jgi:hypothetical protein
MLSVINAKCHFCRVPPVNTKGGSITVPFTSCLGGLDWSALQIKTNIVSCHSADSKPVKQEVNSTVILPPLVFPVTTYKPFVLNVIMLSAVAPMYSNV